MLISGDYGSILREFFIEKEAGDEGAEAVGSQKKKDDELLRELAVLGLTRKMQPKVIVSYERYPYVDKNGNVRVTYDKNIASGTDWDDFFALNPSRIPVLSEGQHLLEVKYDEFLPHYIREIMENGSLRQTTFSKYYICRQERMRR